MDCHRGPVLAKTEEEQSGLVERLPLGPILQNSTVATNDDPCRLPIPCQGANPFNITGLLDEAAILVMMTETKPLLLETAKHSRKTERKAAVKEEPQRR